MNNPKILTYICNHSHFLIIVRHLGTGTLLLLQLTAIRYQTMVRVLVSVMWAAFPVTMVYLGTSANWAFGSM
jgi:hypothetical protein